MNPRIAPWLAVLAAACAIEAPPREVRERPAARPAPSTQPPREPIARPAAPPPARPAPAPRVPGFAEPRLTALDGWPSGLTHGDFNHDGVGDLLVLSLVSDVDHQANLMAAWLGDGRGGYTRSWASEIGEMIVMVAVADLDEDGRPDVIAPRYREKDLAIHRGDGDGGFLAASHVKVTRKPVQVTAADLNRDGHVDVVATYFAHLQVFLGDGKGGLRPLAAFAVGQAPDGPAVADLDGDGKPDLYLVLNDESTFLTLRGGGDGTFRPWFSGRSCGSPSYPQTADFDGDGTLDVAFSCNEGVEPVVEVRLARERGREFVTVKLPADPVEILRVGDFTGDGAPDVVSIGRTSRGLTSHLRLHAGDGKGGFLLRCEDTVGAALGDPIALDADGDGRVDLASTRWPGREPGFVSLWLTTCGP